MAVTATVISFPTARARKPEPPELTDAQLDRLLRDIAKEMREDKAMTDNDDTHGGFIRKPTHYETSQLRDRHAPRTRRDRIGRLRTRLHNDENLRDIVKGVLDLLEDEL